MQLIREYHKMNFRIGRIHCEFIEPEIPLRNTLIIRKSGKKIKMSEYDINSANEHRNSPAPLFSSPHTPSLDQPRSPINTQAGLNWGKSLDVSSRENRSFFGIYCNIWMCTYIYVILRESSFIHFISTL